MSDTKKILIFEDNDLNLKLFCDLLESNNYAVVKSADGIDALNLVTKEMPDLILMDIQLPEISGFDITKILKANDTTKHIPIIAVTAFAMKDDEELILSSGCQDYISKPISITPFLAKIKFYLDKHQDSESKHDS